MSAPKISVAVDARCLNGVHIRGMGKYILEMMTHMPKEPGIDWILLADRPDLPLHVPQGVESRSAIRDCRGYRFHAWEQWMLPRMAKKHQADVLHCVATTLPIWQTVATVVTVHDTLYWAENNSAESASCKSFYWDGVIPRALAKAHSIITISQQSLRDMLELWPGLEPKVEVIPHGVADRYLRARAQEMGRELRELLGRQQYVLYIGGALERKRFAWALEIFREVQQRAPGLLLAACGFSSEEKNAAIANIPAELRRSIRILPYVHEEQMPALYQGAIAVLYPTLYEGFGLPVVESIASGTPILFSALGSLQELGGPGSVVVPPYEMRPWVDGVCNAIESRESRDLRRNEGQLWAQRFSWTKSAERHFAVYAAAGASLERI